MQTILLVEDDKFLREVIAKKLISENYKVIEAINGEEGISSAKEVKPNLILLDLILPGLDGFGLLKARQGDAELNKIPVIVLSNLSQPEEVKRALEMGATDFLIKSNFVPSEIIKKIKRVLD